MESSNDLYASFDSEIICMFVVIFCLDFLKYYDDYKFSQGLWREEGYVTMIISIICNYVVLYAFESLVLSD